EQVAKQLGPVDILVNNAGINRDKSVRKMSAAEWDEVIQTNLYSVFHCTKAVLEPMIARGWGRIINIASIIGQTGAFGQANYAAAKAGVIAFTKSVAQEVAKFGVTVNAICPGFVDTDMVASMPQAAKDADKGRIARGVDGLNAAADEIRCAGGEALILPADVSHAPQVQKAAHALVERWGRIDTWVNDAMVSVFSPVVEMTPEEYRRVTEVNYLGTVHGTLAALRYMLPADEGVILQIGSALVYRSIPLQSAYCASKAAIRGFTDSLRCELWHEKSRIRVTMLQLPAVNTPQFDVVRSRLPRQPQPVPPTHQPER